MFGLKYHYIHARFIRVRKIFTLEKEFHRQKSLKNTELSKMTALLNNTPKNTKELSSCYL
jgi:hypothetical protein